LSRKNAKNCHHFFLKMLLNARVMSVFSVRSLKQKAALAMVAALSAQSFAPLTYANVLYPQQGGGPGGGTGVVVGGSDPWDTLLPDVYTDLPLGHPNEGNTSYNEQRLYMWETSTLETLNDIDYSVDPKDPITWNPTGNNGNSQELRRHVMPWEYGRFGGGGGGLGGGNDLITNTGGGGSCLRIALKSISLKNYENMHYERWGIIKKLMRSLYR
jgi:hypothetical protein